jgi:hypothetical protein
MGDQYDEMARAVCVEWAERERRFYPALPGLIAAALRAAVQAEREHIAVNVLEQTEAQCSLVLRRTRLTDREREWATAEIVREAVAAVHEAPLLTAAPRVEAQGEDEHRAGDVWRHEHEATGEARFSPMRVMEVHQEPPPEPALTMEGGGQPWTPEELASCGWTRVPRGGPQP